MKHPRLGVGAALHGRRLPLCLQVLATVLAAALAHAQVPPGYYDTVDDTDGTTLRLTLHEVIDDHTRYPYTSGATDTWDILESAMEDPNNTGNILDVYQNDSHPKQGGGNTFYNREHSWPKSYGFPDDNSSNYPYTDCHLLWLCDPGYNSARSNRPFRDCSSGCTEYTTLLNNGQGGSGDSNWGKGSFTAGSWEVWSGRRGDLARALLYADVRYEGGLHGGTGAAEPDLILTDVEALIDASNTGNNESVAYMGMLSVLLQWHVQDPPDAWEQNRNDVVYSYQGNRNPFVDHPEWVDCIFNGVCPTNGVGTAVCFGDSTGGVCPCVNWGNPGEGCANSLGHGALLSATGTAVVTNDDLVLVAEQARPSKNGVFLQGATEIASPFKDGILCVGNPTVRLEFTTLDAVGSVSSTISIVTKGVVSPGQTRTYQFWYRDGMGPCNNGSNLSHGLNVDWL